MNGDLFHLLGPEFHFLRPGWLWSLLLLIPFAWSLRRRARSAGPWERVCDPHLLPHLVAQTGAVGTRGPLLLLALAWSAAAIALAGPAWERLPQQTFKEPDRTVFVLGLGASMNGRDVKPSRVARARHKLLDAVDRVSAGSVALVVYRDEAFAVTPLTEDANVLREAIPVLDPKLMPGRAVHPGRGVDEALRLLESVGARGARIVLITDGTDDDPQATEAAVREAADAGARVSVLALTGVSDSLAALARDGGGAAAALAIDDADLDRVLAHADAIDPLTGTSLTKSEIRSDDWKDMGAWLLWIPLLLAPFAFRRGWAAAVAALLCVQFAPMPARAADFDFFQRPDQKGAQAFAEGRFDESAQHFQDPAWQAAARYRAGDFGGAAEVLAAQQGPESQYNLGNALAKAGKLEDAVAAYDRALATTPEHADAHFNRDLVKKLLEEQPPQQQQQQQSKDGESNPDQGDAGETQDPANSQESQNEAGQQAEQGDEPKDTDAGDASKSEGEARPDEAQQDAAPAEPKDGDEGEPRDEAAGDEKQQQQHADAAESPEPGDPPREGTTPDMRSERPRGADQEHAQWMARLPDDPGGLLRERIRRDYLRKQGERREER